MKRKNLITVRNYTPNYLHNSLKEFNYKSLNPICIGIVTPLLRSTRLASLNQIPGWHSIVMPPVGALIPLTFIYYNFKLNHIMLNILLVLYSVAADYKIYTSSIYGSIQYLHCLQKEPKRHIHYTKNLPVDPY